MKRLYPFTVTVPVDLRDNFHYSYCTILNTSYLMLTIFQSVCSNKEDIFQIENLFSPSLPLSLCMTFHAHLYLLALCQFVLKHYSFFFALFSLTIFSLVAPLSSAFTCKCICQARGLPRRSFACE